MDFNRDHVRVLDSRGRGILPARLRLLLRERIASLSRPNVTANRFQDQNEDRLRMPPPSGPPPSAVVPQSSHGLGALTGGREALDHLGKQLAIMVYEDVTCSYRLAGT